MKFIWKVLLIIAGTAIFAVTISTQTEAELKNYFEGRKVEVKLDMPASRGGVNVYPERNQILDFGHYRELLKKYGIGIRDGERIMITKIKVKDKHIEFQLGGGGYGSWTDETSADIYVPSASKTVREKNLEKDLKNENDPGKRRAIKEELSSLRRRRERENSRNQAETAAAEEIAKQRIQDKRLQAGSRFNIRFERQVAETDITPEAVLESLEQYVELVD